MSQCPKAAVQAAKLYIANVRTVERSARCNYFDAFVRKVMNSNISWPEFVAAWSSLLHRHNLDRAPQLASTFAQCTRGHIMHQISRIAVDEFNANTLHGNTSSNTKYRNDPTSHQQLGGSNKYPSIQSFKYGPAILYPIIPQIDPILGPWA